MDLSRYAARLAELPAASSTGKAIKKEKVALTAVSRLLSNFAYPAQPQNLPEEPEDAHLTGGTRSLSRRLLALNFPPLGKPQIKTAKKSGLRKSGILEPVTET